MPDLHDDLALFERAQARAAPLSAAGQARRQTMRSSLLAEVERRRRARRTARAAVTVAALAAAVWLGSRLLLRAPDTRPPAGATTLHLAHVDFAVAANDAARFDAAFAPPPKTAEVVAGSWPPRYLEFATARPDEAALAAMRPAPRPLPTETAVDDAGVLQLLAAADRPTGLVRSPAGVFFTRDVFDPIAGGE
ncbi:MAG: hypothetical protein R3F56_23865 [Planctomycetota bacterium]